MGRVRLTLFLLLFLVIHTLGFAQNGTPTAAICETFGGGIVCDSMYWMENVNSDAMQKWLKAQHALTQKVEAGFNGTFIKAYNNILKSGYAGVPLVYMKNKYFFAKNYADNPYQNYPTIEYGNQDPRINTAIYVNHDTRISSDFNPGKFFPREAVEIVNFMPSDSMNDLVAIVSVNNSKELEIRAKSIASGKYYPDVLQHIIKPVIEWWNDGFFYTRAVGSSSDLQRQQLCYHRLGEQQSADQIVLNVPDSANSFFAFKRTAGRNILIVYTAAKLNGRWCKVVQYKNLDEGVLSPFQTLVVAALTPKLDFDVIDLIDSNFITRTDYGAPNFRLMKYRLGSINNGQELVPQFADVLVRAYHVNHSFLLIYFDKGIYKGAVFDYAGNKKTDIHFPKYTSVNNFIGEPSDSIVVFSQNTFYSPAIVYTVNLNTSAIDYYMKTLVSYSFNDYTTRIINYTTRDSVQVPMYITFKKGLPLNGNHPVLLYALSCNHAVADPNYNYSNIIFCASGGIVAVPLIRGSNGLGDQWYKGGTGLNTQNAINDIVDAAGFLEKEGFTTNEHMVLEGDGSSGTMLGAAAIEQNPGLFKIFVGNDGVYDLFKTRSLRNYNWWEATYGNPDKESFFKCLLGYSPIQHINGSSSLPKTLLFHSSISGPELEAQTHKFLAALQQKATDPSKNILYFLDDPGHSGSMLNYEQARKQAFKLAFILNGIGSPLIIGE